jgi:hypothetical protein
MTVESATYINGLNASNPSSSDLKSEGDDHIRLVKSTVKATFPNVVGAVTLTDTQLNAAAVKDGSGNLTISGNWIDLGTAVNSISGFAYLHTDNFTTDTSRVLPSYGVTWKVMSWSSSNPVAHLTGYGGVSLWAGGTEVVRVTSSGVTVTGTLNAAIPWTSVSGKPSNVSYFSNDSGYQTTSGTVTNLSGGTVNATTVTASSTITGGGDITVAGRFFGHNGVGGGTGLGRITTTSVSGSPAGTNAGDFVLVY